MILSEVQQRDALAAGRRLLAEEPAEQALARLCRWLRASFPRYDWTGIYILEGEELFLAAWDGAHATEHSRIPLARGLCGMAAREHRTVNVADVRTRPEYLSCFLETRSEIVVPILDGPTVLGEIDIDGKEEAAYDDSDARLLEALARACVPHARRALTSRTRPG